MGGRQPDVETEERAEMLHYLVAEIGIEQRDGEVAVQDGDLWSFIDAGSLFPFDGGEAAA